MKYVARFSYLGAPIWVPLSDDILACLQKTIVTIKCTAGLNLEFEMSVLRIVKFVIVQIYQLCTMIVFKD